ncbi:MAG: amidohydrolase, partial [Candidatus Heimdallarchaeota archaeon]|nr:amidohydrolase [Candidatus Heimdallarchaeota archaeon]
DSSISIDEAQIIDCSGTYITPGLIDPHSHVGLFEEGAGMGYGDGNETTDPITPQLRALDAILPEDIGFDDARKGGVTTMGILPGSGNLIGGQAVCIKSYGIMIDDMVVKSPAGVKFALGENPRRVYKEMKKSPSTRMASAFLIRQAFYKAMDYRVDWLEYQQKIKKENIKPEEERAFIKEPKFDMTLDILLKILSREIPVRCHSHRADDIRTAIRLADEFGFKLVIDHATESAKIGEYIASRGFPVVVGPLMTSRSKRELKDRSLKTPGIMMKYGVQVSLTTDAPVIPIYMLRESMIIATREGLPVESALETITINPAKVLGVDDRVGSLKIGKDADFVIWDDDPMDVRAKAIKTFIDGNLVYEYLE